MQLFFVTASVEIAAACGSTALRLIRSAGNSMVKVDPLPGSLSTRMVPRIISQKCLVMVNPRPVPPNRRVVEPSAWLNAWNNLLICSAVIPMPVSVTAKVITDD